MRFQKIWNIIFINPTAVFGLEIALVPIAMALLGGSGTVLGPIVGSVFITLVEELLWTKVPYLHLAVYGMVGFSITSRIRLVRFTSINGAISGGRITEGGTGGGSRIGSS